MSSEPPRRARTLRKDAHAPVRDRAADPPILDHLLDRLERRRLQRFPRRSRCDRREKDPACGRVRRCDRRVHRDPRAVAFADRARLPASGSTHHVVRLRRRIPDRKGSPHTERGVRDRARRSARERRACGDLLGDRDRSSPFAESPDRDLVGARQDQHAARDVQSHPRVPDGRRPPSAERPLGRRRSRARHALGGLGRTQLCRPRDERWRSTPDRAALPTT